MEKRFIIKLISNRWTQETIDYTMPSKDNTTYDNSLKFSIDHNYFFINDPERENQVIEQYEYADDNKNFSSKINLQELDNDIILHAKDFCKKNNNDICNAYVYYGNEEEETFLLAYLIRFKANNYPEVNWDNPQIIRCDAPEFIKLYRRDKNTFEKKHARLDFKEEDNPNGEVYKITNIERFDEIKEDNKMDRMMIIIGIIGFGLFALFMKLIIKEAEIVPDEPAKPFLYNLLFAVLFVLNTILGSVDLTLILGGFSEIIQNLKKKYLIRKNGFQNNIAKKEIKKLIKEMKENNIEIS